jgi:hypothetical protein
MTALVQALSRLSHTDTTTEAPLKVIAIFCFAGLLFSLVLATHGVDLSPGLF